ncbi:NAD(P)-dependent oxidoreductase [Lutibaculum baratangense]|uniref:3-hydroxyisobutyrate dehydrogenase n=1 Tax=Lutibaculum baratangense AMV1 TaxID=631454 RepID=V4RH43_9HYPH|nr:NAD(P)-dependent oxidoreductase [Lutibaculum baratangense]ESR22610.1 hypothetical protein N177_3746 [Lutibaculum baratangense AMV1]
MKIAFIGFGEAAAAFQETLAAQDRGLAFSTYDILFDSEGLGGKTAGRAKAARVEVSPTPADAVAGADWVVAAVTAASSLEAAESVVAHLRDGQVYLDINSVSPGRKRETAALLEPKGVTYVDMAVMAPVHPKGHRTPVLIAGGFPPEVTDLIKRLDFKFEKVGEDIGSATAIKMVRSVFVKGLEAITIEALLGAEKAGCLDRVLPSLASSFPGLGWPDFALYEFERALTHGVRRAAEMRESGKTLDELGLHGDLARAIAAVHDRMGSMKETLEGERFSPLADEIRTRTGKADAA